MGVEVPRRPHDAARKVELDVVHAVLDLLADGFDPAIRTVDLQCMARSQEVSARGGEKMAAGEQPRAMGSPRWSMLLIWTRGAAFFSPA